MSDRKLSYLAIAISVTAMFVSFLRQETLPVKWTQSDVELKLASLDEKRSLRGHEPIIDRYAMVLDRLEGKCTETRSRLADITAIGVKRLRDGGHTTTYMEMLISIDTGVPSIVQEKIGRTPCAEVAAAIVTLMTTKRGA